MVNLVGQGAQGAGGQGTGGMGQGGQGVGGRVKGGQGSGGQVQEGQGARTRGQEGQGAGNRGQGSQGASGNGPSTKAGAGCEPDNVSVATFCSCTTEGDQEEEPTPRRGMEEPIPRQAMQDGKKTKVDYLGSVPIDSKATDLSSLQVPMKNLYLKFIDLKSLGHQQLPGTLEISETGLKVNYIRELHRGVQEIFNPFPTIAVWAAVKFVHKKERSATGEIQHR